MKTKNFKLFRVLLAKGISKENISNASLRSVDLSNANLRSVDLSDADLSNVNISNANLSDVDLSNANLSNANLSNANLSNADLKSVDLSDASLSNANLSNANLSNADFSNADLKSVDLSGIHFNESTFGIIINCPEEGEFIGFKKCQNNVIVKLLILSDSKRSSATSYKCRCSKVKVLEIEGGLTEIASTYNSNFIYKVGEIKEVTNFDENRWNECSTGIHFFMSREMAKQYN